MANSNTPAEVTALRSKQLRQDAIRSHLNHRDASQARERIQVCFCQLKRMPFLPQEATERTTVALPRTRCDT
eukprot:scaffold858_cov193-Alexandrium_tamarense.AAC.15